MRTVRRGSRGALIAALATVLAGCGVDLSLLPLPAPGGSGKTYGLTAVFSNALNLPSKAKVRLLGADVGEVESIHAKDFTAHVYMLVRANVPLHQGATAELRQATPLGDVFLQIRPSPNQDAPLLRDGDTIGLKSTSAAPSIEDLLSSLALLVNGGAARHLMQIANGAGRAVGGRGEKLRELMDGTKAVLSKLTARSTQLDTSLRRTSELAATMAARRQTLDESLVAAAPAMSVIADNTTRIADLADGVARITNQLSKFPSIQGTDSRSTMADINRLAGSFNDIAVDPDLSLYPFNRAIGVILRSFSSNALHGVGEVSKLSLVPWPDLNYPGDPGFHWPDGTDWHLMIGSIRYEWNLLLDKIYGPARG
ncbi:MlaD family protein [Mycobacterium sp.]|uniref:MlaD family protein n=1 Tax=Mycobacterium sp. TaxID=1785 RepID=UPI003A88063E